MCTNESTMELVSRYFSAKLALPLTALLLTAVLLLASGCKPEAASGLPDDTPAPPAATPGDAPADNQHGHTDSDKPSGGDPGSGSDNGQSHTPPDTGIAKPTGQVQFDEPTGITYANGKLYIADTNNHRIRTVDLNDNYKTATFRIEGLTPPSAAPEAERSVAAQADTNDEPDSNDEKEAPATDEGDNPQDPRLAQPRPPQPVDEADDDLLVEAHPFPGAKKLPIDFPDDMQWLNTSKPIKLEDLKGKFVILDFWTYCCINCIHILPELKKLERQFPNELVVIGVHSAKFETEKSTKNIEEAILRYEIEHPVVNDRDHAIWDMFLTRSWPTLVFIDPEGKYLGSINGEIEAEPIAENLLKKHLPYYRKHGLLNETPIQFDLLKDKQESTPLRFPSKVLADDANMPGKLFIADSNHNRIVISSLAGKLIDTIGTGAIGQDDGDYDTATFNKPQGMALLGETLYVADTENHLIRKINLKEKTVSTIAGKGVQGRNAWPGAENLTPLDDLPERFVAKPLEFAINSPWALYVHGEDLYIAMAGPHQIWRMKLDESEIGPYAGNGREDIVDGELLPPAPYEMGYSSFAQPSGLASDGEWLYVADSEGSSIRAVPFDAKQRVKTLVGTNNLEFGRLFEFGHRDGTGEEMLLQHPLGVVHHEGKLYVADTYNNAIREIDIATRTSKTIAGPPGK